MRKINLTSEWLTTLKESQNHHTKHNVRNISTTLFLLNKGIIIPPKFKKLLMLEPERFTLG
jgi:hypothetical protein